MKRCLLGLLLTVYCVVALMNYSLTQSLLGSYVGGRISEGSGGVVKIGSLHVNPFSHVVLHDVLLVTPDGDTVADARRIACYYKKFPLNDEGLKLRKVRLDDVYYHLQLFPNRGINLEYLITFFGGSTHSGKPQKPFVVEVDELLMNNIHYKQDLVEHYHHRYPYGVDYSHMEFYNIGGKLKHIRVVNDDVKCRFVTFHATEKSGFVLKDLSMDVDVSPKGIYATDMELQTESMRLLCDASLTYNSWKTMQYYCDSVPMDLVLKTGTVVDMSDVAYWAPALWDVKGLVTLEGHAYGPVADLHAENFTLSVGDRTSAFFDGYITGLPSVEKMDINANLYQFITNAEDVTSLLNGFHVPQNKMLSNLIQSAGEMNISGNVIGTLKDCYANVGLHSNVGTVESDLTIRYNANLKDYAYSADVSSSGINFAALFPNEWVGQSGFDLMVEGVGFNPATMEATLSGMLSNSSVKGVPLQNTLLYADIAQQKLTADVKLQDPHLNFDLSGSVDWNDSIAAYSADFTLQEANLAALKLWQPENIEEATLSLLLHADLAGNSLDAMQGQVSVENCLLRMDHDTLMLNTTTLTSQPRRNRKNINLTNEWLNLSLRGYFDYADLPLVVNHFEQNYLPQYYQYQLRDSLADWSSIADASVYIDLSLKDISQPLQFFAPNVGIANNTSLHGSYNFAESLKMVLRSDSISIGGTTLHNIGLNGGLNGQGYALELDVDAFSLGASPLFEQVRCKTSLHHSRSQARLIWNSLGEQESSNWGDIELTLLSDEEGNNITITKPLFSFADNVWRIASDKPIYFAADTLAVEALRISGNHQAITTQAFIGNQIEDYIAIDFSQLSIDRISDLLLHNSGLSIVGDIDGQCNISGWEQTAYMNAALTVKGCEVNDYPLGDIALLSDWNADMGQLNLTLLSTLFREAGTLHPLRAKGTVGLDKGDPSLNFDVALEQLQMEMLEPLLRGVVSEVEGQLSADIKVAGSLQQPTLDGYLAINDAHLQVDATGVVYSFADTLTIANGKLNIDNLHIYDPKNNQATLSGSLSYEAPMGLNLRLQTNNFMVLDNKSSGMPYYGTIFAAVDGCVSGAFNDLYISGSARTNPGSDITVTITDKKTIKSQNFITFVGDENLNGSSTQQQQHSRSGLHLDLSATITPDVKLSLPMDLSQTYVKIGAIGRGDLRLTINEGSAPSVLGEYEILSGNMGLTLLSLLSTNFTIDEGSSIDFRGDVSNIQFDIKAAHSQRVNISTLTGSAGSADNSQKNIAVENVIALSGQLTNPTVSFDIRLPNADQSVEEEVFAYIDRTDEREMLNQSVSLLLFGKFASATTPAAEQQSSSLMDYAPNGFSVMTTAMGGLLSSMVDFVDLNFDYRAATDLTNEQFDVNISKEWNKLYFESTLGYGVESQDLNTESGAANSTYNLVGDMLVGYKVNPMLHLFVFNRSNTNDYTRNDLPYKQGVGLKLTKDFDKWKDLWHKSK